jgi:hypothetical protein
VICQPPVSVVALRAPFLLLSPFCRLVIQWHSGHAKIAFASSNYFGEREDLVEGTVDDLLLSVAMDYADLHGQEAPASHAGRSLRAAKLDCKRAPALLQRS